MEPGKITTGSQKGKHLNFGERIIIEQMSRVGAPTRDIAKALGKSQRTIQRELKRGQVTNESLLEKRKRKKGGRRSVRKVRKAHTMRKRIDQRPKEIETREQAGHWEIDLVVGPTKASNTALLTLVERKTRHLICRRLPDKSQDSVVKAINGIEREYGAVKFREIFRSITANNGSEFLDVDALERSVFSEKKRTTVYYADPYCSWQRGTNENTNRIIRRFVAKGRDIAHFTKKAVLQFTEWINA